MAKKKLTVTVDESILEDLNRLGYENVSATVNEALRFMIERRVRLEALGRLVDELIAANGEPTAEQYAAAEAAFADLAVGSVPPTTAAAA